MEVNKAMFTHPNILKRLASIGVNLNRDPA
jgi:hypothetical protein